MKEIDYNTFQTSSEHWMYLSVFMSTEMSLRNTQNTECFIPILTNIISFKIIFLFGLVI